MIVSVGPVKVGEYEVYHPGVSPGPNPNRLLGVHRQPVPYGIGYIETPVFEPLPAGPGRYETRDKIERRATDAAGNHHANFPEEEAWIEGGPGCWNCRDQALDAYRQRLAEEKAARERKHAKAVEANNQRFGSDQSLRQALDRASSISRGGSVPAFLGLLSLAGMLVGGVLQLQDDWLRQATYELLPRKTLRDVAAFPIGIVPGACLSVPFGVLGYIVAWRRRRAGLRAARIPSRIGCGDSSCRRCKIPASPAVPRRPSVGEVFAAQLFVALLGAAVVAFVVLVPGAEVRGFRDAALPRSMRSSCIEVEGKPTGVYYILRCRGRAVRASGVRVVYLLRTESLDPQLPDVTGCVADESFSGGGTGGRCGSRRAAWTGPPRLVGLVRGRRAARFAFRRARRAVAGQ